MQRKALLVELGSMPFVRMVAKFNFIVLRKGKKLAAYFIALKQELSSFLIMPLVVVLEESLLMVLLLLLQERSMLEDQLFITFEKLLVTILPYFRLLELLFLIKWPLLDHDHQLGTLEVLQYVLCP